MREKMRDFSKEIRAYALRNAIEFGKADASKILPKLFQHGLRKEDIKKIIPKVQEIVREVNSLSKAEREKEFGEYVRHVKEKEKRERVLPELPNVGGKVVMRAAPFPSGAIHIGNAKTFILNSLYAEKYKGKLFLVMDDTIGSEEKPIDKESYKLIEKAFAFLGIKYEKIIYKSDRLKIYYEHAEKLIEKNKAYVCHCLQSKFKKYKDSMKECPCRNLPNKEQLERWKEMFKLSAGKAVLRIKTDMKHKNPAFRDRVLFKISDRAHPRVGKKYRVWPSLEMSWSVDDYLLGITHIIRGNDLLMESDMEKFIWNIFSWKAPEIIHTGLIQIEEAKISKSKAQKEVKSGKFIGWDDPRTWSIGSLERRGISAAALREFFEEIGLNKQDINIPIESLYAINRHLIDEKADRYSFILDPRELKIENAPDIREAKVPIHPDKKETRTIGIGKIFISGNDWKKFKGKEIRLIHLYNIKLNNKSVFISKENKDIPKINWVSENVKSRILMPDGEWIKGIADRAVSKLKKGSMIQFERFAFVRFDGKKGNLSEFWFAHK